MSHNVFILAVPGVQMLDVCGPIDVFAEANRVLKRSFYSLRVVSVTDPVIRSSSGVKITADATLSDCGGLTADTFLVAGAPDIAYYQPDPVCWMELTHSASQASGLVQFVRGHYSWRSPES